MGTSLIRGKYIICQITSRTTAQVIADGAVVQRDGVIIDVGPYQDMATRYQPDDVLGSAEHVVGPGLVNSHHHVGLTPFPLGSPDYPLELWFASRLGARPVDPYLDTLYSAFEMGIPVRRDISYNWLQVFRRADTARLGSDRRLQHQTRGVR